MEVDTLPLIGGQGPLIGKVVCKTAAHVSYRPGEKVNDPPDISGQFFDWLVSKGRAEEFWIKP